MTNAAFSDAALSGATFTIGGAFGRAFEVFRRKWVSFTLLSLIATAPTLLSAYYFSSYALNPAATTPSSLFWSTIPSIWITVAFVLVAQVSIFYGAYQEMRGQPFTVAQSISAGLKRLGPAFCVMVVIGFMMIFGFILLVVPGLIVVCMTYVAVPACVVERPGIFASVGRSRVLTKGFRWQIFGLLLIMGITTGIVGVIGRLVLGGGFSLSAATISIPVLVFNYVWNAIYIAFSTVVSMVVYHQLRIVKEGVDIEAIAGIFD